MTRLRRAALWAAVLSPVAALPTAYAVARIWLNHHLQRELAFGEYRLRLIHPALDWDLDFAADSVDFASPGLHASTGTVSAEVRIWNSLASLKPSVKVALDTVRIGLAPRARAAAERARKAGRSPAFPNLRIPIEFRVASRRLEIRSDGRFLAAVREPALQSQGPKGAACEWSGIELGLPADTTPDGAASRLELAYSGRASARWFGTWVRYQVRAQDGYGAIARVEGERRKSDLRMGRDSLEAELPDLGAFAPLFRRGAPGFRGLSVQAAWGSGEHKTLKARLAFETPPVWVIARHRAEVSVDLEDSLGRLTLSTRGPAGETGYLQGRFSVPLADSGGPAAWLPRLKGEFAGYSRNLRFPIGRRVLPGDAEIRKLKVLPGPVLEAQVRTRDSSVAEGRLFRGADSAWTVVFEGRPSPTESWAHAWTDTNLAYRSARVKGQADRRGLRIEAWVAQPRAYGFAGDSAYAAQGVDKSGYYLYSSKVYGKDAIWPVAGEVTWKKAAAATAGRKRRRVSLEFRTQHPRYGSLVFGMPSTRQIRVRADSLRAHRLPYVRLPRLSALAPLVTGSFAWDIRAREGELGASATITYVGQALDARADASWDAASLSLSGFEVSMGGAAVRLAGAARLGGRQFWQAGKLGIKDIRALSLEARNFDAARLAPFAGPAWPVARGVLDGRFTYDDSAGFGGSYRIEDLDLIPVRKLATVPRLVLTGRGASLILTARTASNSYPWFNDSLRIEVGEVLGDAPGVTAEALSDDGLRIGFRGRLPRLRALDGAFSAAGKATLPGGAGEIRELRLGGRLSIPFGRDILSRMALDSGTFAGRYAIPALDTQAFGGSATMRAGRLRIPDLRASDARGPTLAGEAECDLAGPPKVTARLRGDDLALAWPGIQKIVLRGAQASLRVDSAGLAAEAEVARAEFAASRPPIGVRGNLEKLSAAYFRPSPPRDAKAPEPTPQLRLKAALRDFLFKHSIGFRELQKSIGKVKVDKRKRRSKPVELQLDLETAGANNRVETDVLRMAFAGDLSVRGVYPYTLLTGGFSSLKGELGQTSQSYDITEFDLKWQNATLEEGRVSVEGGKKLRVNCKPETERTCNVFVKLSGRLDEMAFTYDSDCGANTGGTLEPTALINSVNRGCWSEEDVAGAGNGNYREAVVALLEPTLNEKLSRVGERFTGGWIKRTSVTGIGTAVAKDTTGNEPLAIGVETKEKWGASLKASAGYHPEKREENTWESKLALEWRPPLEKASGSSEWKRRVRDRVTLEASVETRPEEKVTSENKDARMQVGLRYRYKFWNLW